MSMYMYVIGYGRSDSWYGTSDFNNRSQRKVYATLGYHGNYAQAAGKAGSKQGRQAHLFIKINHSYIMHV